VSAHREGDTTVVLIPARMTRAEERHWVDLMVQRLAAREQRRTPSDERLLARARRLSREHLDGRAVPASVRWADNQGGRWGSCTVPDRTIRISTRLRGAPPWVLDYVLVHELAHLLVAAHDERFWALVARYPRTERARGYLEGFAAAAGVALSDDDPAVDLREPVHPAD